MGKTTRNLGRIIISILYIIWGLTAPLTAINAILALDIGAILSASVGVIMLLAGVFGLLKIKPATRRIFGVIIFVLAAVSFVTSLAGGGFAWQPLLSALLAWLYIVC